MASLSVEVQCDLRSEDFLINMIQKLIKVLTTGNKLEKTNKLMREVEQVMNDNIWVWELKKKKRHIEKPKMHLNFWRQKLVIAHEPWYMSKIFFLHKFFSSVIFGFMSWFFLLPHSIALRSLEKLGQIRIFTSFFGKLYHFGQIPIASKAKISYLSANMHSLSMRRLHGIGMAVANSKFQYTGPLVYIPTELELNFSSIDHKNMQTISN